MAEGLSVRLPRSMAPRAFLTIAFAVAIGITLLLLLIGAPFAMVPAGFAAFLGGMLFGDTDPPIAGVEGDPEASTIALRRQNGDVVLLPRSAVAGARVTVHSSSSSSSGVSSKSYGVALRKHDGGGLALCQTGGRRERAESLVAEIDALLEAVPPRPEREADLVRDAERRLLASPSVDFSLRAETGDGYRGKTQQVLELSWSLRQPAGRVAILPLAIGGMAMIVGGMTRWLGLVHVLGIAAAMLVLSLGFMARSAGRSTKVRVDDDHLRIITMHGATPSDEKALPLEGVNAVDLAWTGPLMIRVDEANDEIRKLMAKRDRGPQVGLLGALRGVLALLRQTIQIDTGALSFEERFDLEVVLGAHVATRTGRDVGAL